MTDVDSLKEAIAQYELQLAQVQRTLSVTVQESDRDNLLSLKADIEELIDLTKESLHNLESPDAENKSGGENSNDDSDDPLAREYALFKAELEKVSDDSEPAREEENSAEASENANNIEEELKQLEGMKCRAPHGSTWGGTGYHNAMISSVHGNNDKEIKNIQDIQVRVLFLNPTHKEMLPCPYYLDGNCKFSEEDCRFSHGELVPFSSLQQYREPDFQSIKIGSRVLAKQRNKLWHRSVVLKVPDKEEDDYRVKFEVNGNVVEVGLQDLLPLGDADLEMSDSSEDSDSDSEEEELEKLTLDREMQLGNWEKHTRGIGSKLMAQMGYVAGTGLGKRADGRIEPVEPTALPAGKSLDHCMELRESTSCGKSRRKRHKKLKQRRERQYQRAKQREDNNEFNAGGNGSGKKSCLKEETSRPLSDDSDCESDQQEFDREEAIHKSLLTLDRDMPLGNWEKHTRGIGSKLMAQMGYIVGTGLGKRADGRVEPVEATVLPAGKSLDHCMELRESAGGDKNLFSAARKMRKREKKLEQQRERQYQREKQREKNNVFNFINATLGDKPKQDGEASCSRRKSNLKEESNRDLNVAKFQIGENIMRLERVSSKLKESLSRHAKGSAFYNNIVMQYNEKQKELTSLRASEKSIAAEQNQRRSKAKLSIF